MTVRVRRDVWNLGDEADPWRDPVIVAYAEGVAAMRALSTSDPDNGANWVNQAAIHGAFPPAIQGRLENQCQHGCWFFLPWHRMYLYRFEEIVRSHLDDEQAEEWALPYWNYSKAPDRRVLPPAFRTPTLPNGDTNPLYTPARSNVNGGTPVPGSAVDLTAAMAPDLFSRAPNVPPRGFGGERTNPLFHHAASGPSGPLESVPHGTVHTAVGGPNGLMTLFETAGLDPIFWLHYANIDRLWEVWRRGTPQRQNPTDASWLNAAFDLVDPTDTVVQLSVGDVLDIEQQLSYTYEELPIHVGPLVDEERDLVPDHDDRMPDHDLPTELVGTNDRPLIVEGVARASTTVTVSPADRPDQRGLLADARASGVYLTIEDVEGEANPGLLYGVYVNLPEGEEPDPDGPYHVGTLSFFGIESTLPDDAKDDAPHRLGYVLDITDRVAQLTERGQWDAGELQVTVAPLGLELPTSSQRALLEEAQSPVRIGRVGVFVR